MIYHLIHTFKKLDKKIVSLMKFSWLFCFMIAILSTSFLISYHFYPLPILFTIGFSIVKTTLFFAVTILICGIGFDTILKEKHT